MNLQSKMTVYAAIAAMLALMGGIVYYSSLDNPFLEQVQIELGNVEVIDINNIQNKATLEVTFQVTNPTDKTFTIPSISYDLSGDGNPIGAGQYSTEDIAMPDGPPSMGEHRYPSRASLHNLFGHRAVPRYRQRPHPTVRGDGYGYRRVGLGPGGGGL